MKDTGIYKAESGKLTQLSRRELKKLFPPTMPVILSLDSESNLSIKIDYDSLAKHPDKWAKEANRIIKQLSNRNDAVKAVGNEQTI